MRFLRVFRDGAEEHRADEAYTVANVPKAFAGQPWHVEQRDDVPAPPAPPLLLTPTVAAASSAWAQHLARSGQPAVPVAAQPWQRDRTQQVATAPPPPAAPTVGGAESFWVAYLASEADPASTQPPWRRTYR